jgi:NAD(P)H-hydrate epimerase
MNRAARVFTDRLLEDLGPEQALIILCGTGNNGGDGLAIFRYLKRVGVDVRCYLVPFGAISEDCSAQFDLVHEEVITWKAGTLPAVDQQTVIIDALLGIGSNREPHNELKEVIHWMNSVLCPVYSVDLPSGLPADELPSYECIVRAEKTFTFHAPKLTFFLPETAEFAGEWEVLDIGLSKEASNQMECTKTLVREEDISALIPERKRFSHKGTYGHGLLIAGSDGKMGACLLSAEAALRSGLGLLTVHTVLQGKYCLHQRIPEAMAQWDINENELSGDCIPPAAGFSAIGIGPGTGTIKGGRIALEQVLASKQPCVIDADALNILSAHPELVEKLHENCVLTPHPKEFERLTGVSESSLDRLQRALDFSLKYGCVLVLKDAITVVINPEGIMSFNSTGNPGMAKGGCGDALTGIILGCLTQGIKPFDAARIAVYHHGLAGDKAKQERGERAMLPEDLISKLAI